MYIYMHGHLLAEIGSIGVYSGCRDQCRDWHELLFSSPRRYWRASLIEFALSSSLLEGLHPLRLQAKASGNRNVLHELK